MLFSTLSGLGDRKGCRRLLVAGNLIGVLLMILCLHASALNAQVKFQWMKDKPGTWVFKSNLSRKTADELQFERQTREFSEWLRMNVPLFKKPAGYDVNVHVLEFSGRQRRLSANSPLSAEMVFKFLLFDKTGSAWTSELPSASYYKGPFINRLAGSGSWVGSIGQFDYFSTEKHDPKLEEKINRAAAKLDEMMFVLPLERELAPGLHLYKAEAGGKFVVVFRPDRPAYLVPVTLRELAEAYSDYYSLFRNIEIDRMLLQELKKELAGFSTKELDGPAFFGHPSNVVFRYSSDNRNLPVMRMNPKYWDPSLPPSAIQLMVFWKPESSDSEMAEHLGRFGYPIHSQELVNQFDWKRIAQFVANGK